MQNDRTGTLFRFLKNNWPRHAIIDVKFEKNKIFDGFSGSSFGGREPDPIFLIQKKRFFPGKLLEGVSVFFFVSRLFMFPCLFWLLLVTVPKMFVGTGWIYGVKK